MPLVIFPIIYGWNSFKKYLLTFDKFCGFTIKQKPTPQPATDLSNFLNSTSIELPKSDFKIKKRRETLEQILTEK